MVEVKKEEVRVKEVKIEAKKEIPATVTIPVPSLPAPVLTKVQDTLKDDKTVPVVKKIVQKAAPVVVAAPVEKKKPESPFLKISKEIFDVDLSSFAEYLGFNPTTQKYFVEENTYKILSYLAKQLPKGSKVADLGTALGASALAFATNPDIEVLTIDSVERLPVNLRNVLSLPNVSFTSGDSLTLTDLYTNAKIVYVDLHPHDGIQEGRIYQFLASAGFKGIMILDDIHAFEGLSAFWSTIIKKKMDVTEYGHHSGTGIVVFSPGDLDVIVK